MGHSGHLEHLIHCGSLWGTAQKESDYREWVIRGIWSTCVTVGHYGALLRKNQITESGSLGASGAPLSLWVTMGRWETVWGVKKTPRWFVEFVGFVGFVGFVEFVNFRPHPKNCSMSSDSLCSLSKIVFHCYPSQPHIKLQIVTDIKVTDGGSKLGHEENVLG